MLWLTALHFSVVPVLFHLLLSCHHLHFNSQSTSTPGLTGAERKAELVRRLTLAICNGDGTEGVDDVLGPSNASPPSPVSLVVTRIVSILDIEIIIAK